MRRRLGPVGGSALFEPRPGFFRQSPPPAYPLDLPGQVEGVRRLLADLEVAVSGGPTPELIAAAPLFEEWDTSVTTVFLPCIRGTATRHPRACDGRVALSERLWATDASLRWALAHDGFVRLGRRAPSRPLR